jgi:phosphoglucosamine mutase
MDLRYFGTDGVRGRAYESPLRIEQLVRWGQAWGRVARDRGVQELVLGWDPRESSEPMAKAFIQGLEGSLNLCVLGMVPTPAVAWVTARREKAWGLMISASHNPPEDNGIKGFDGKGEKLGEEDEQALEVAFDSTHANKPFSGDFQPCTEPMEAYLNHLEGIDLPPKFRLVVDCAHGATAPYAPRLIRGGEITWLGVPANGGRINVGVGSTHLDALQAKVRECGADAGIAFDGDGDRCLVVDPQGELVDGDQIIWLMTQDLLAQGEHVPGVVGTLMSNGGLESVLKERKVPFVRTPVGDKHMLRELARKGWDLAAEASGHIIQKHLGPSGDGLATALATLHALLHRPAEQRWTWRFRPWPLRLVNIQAKNRKPVEECPCLQEAMNRFNDGQNPDLRIVVRWSGTEPKLRLMVEAREESSMNAALASLEAAARQDLSL